MWTFFFKCECLPGTVGLQPADQKHQGLVHKMASNCKFWICFMHDPKISKQTELILVYSKFFNQEMLYHSIKQDGSTYLISRCNMVI